MMIVGQLSMHLLTMDTTPNDVWNILQHLARKILHARLCLHVARRQSNKMPLYSRKYLLFTILPTSNLQCMSL